MKDLAGLIHYVNHAFCHEKLLKMENEIGTPAIRILTGIQTAEQLVKYSTGSGSWDSGSFTRNYNRQLTNSAH